MEKKEIIKKLGNNNFTLTFNNSGKIYPWYVYHNSKKWLQLTEMNKISIIILDLIKKSIKNYKNSRNKKNIFVLKYEDYVCKPVYNLKKISKFLRTNFSSQTIKKLKKLELPLNISAIEYKRDIRKRIIKKKLDPKLYKKLEKLEQEL